MSIKETDTRKKAFVIDTSALVHDPSCIDKLRKNDSTVTIPWIVLIELDNLKDRPDIGIDAREATRKIEEIRKNGDDTVTILRNPSFRNLGVLDRKIHDHQIIATARTIEQKKERKVVLISRDRTMRILTRELGMVAEDYVNDQVVIPKSCLKEINVPFGCVDQDTLLLPIECCRNIDEVQENEGVLCYSDFNDDGEWRKSFAAIRKGDFFKIILDISACGIKPYSLNGGEKNWFQYITLTQLLDQDIKLVFLQGGAGSGKTLLALASAIEQRKSYRQIVVTRPMVHLEDEDRMGFLPGNEKEKMSPWTRPIYQALDFIKDSSVNNKALIEKMLEEKKIDFESLDYIRGTTYFKTMLIVDEAQNLTPHQVKTIITRAGNQTKVVFTGDLGQIDRRRRLDEKSSGLAYAIARMNNSPLVAVTNFKETVRSSLASLAEERM